MLEERGKPFLRSTPNPTEIAIETAEAQRDELGNLLSTCVQSTALWFRIEYTLGGVRCGISPKDFMDARVGNDESRLRFIKNKTQELMEGSGVILSIINPARPERPPGNRSSSS